MTKRGGTLGGSLHGSPRIGLYDPAPIRRREVQRLHAHASIAAPVGRKVCLNSASWYDHGPLHDVEVRGHKDGNPTLGAAAGPDPSC